jgi:hypothetical protein
MTVFWRKDRGQTIVVGIAVAGSCSGLGQQLSEILEAPFQLLPQAIDVGETRLAERDEISMQPLEALETFHGRIVTDDNPARCQGHAMKLLLDVPNNESRSGLSKTLAAVAICQIE